MIQNNNGNGSIMSIDLEFFWGESLFHLEQKIIQAHKRMNEAAISTITTGCHLETEEFCKSDKPVFIVNPVPSPPPSPPQSSTENGSMKSSSLSKTDLSIFKNTISKSKSLSRLRVLDLHDECQTDQTSPITINEETTSLSTCWGYFVDVVPELTTKPLYRNFLYKELNSWHCKKPYRHRHIMPKDLV